MEWFLANWQTVVMWVFGLGLVYAGLNIRKTLKELHDLTNAFNDFMGSLSQAAEDNKLTPEEWADIKKAWNRVMVEAADVGGIVVGIAQIIARIGRR